MPPSLLCYLFLALMTDTDYITLSLMKLSIFDLFYFYLQKWSFYMVQPTIVLPYFVIHSHSRLYAP